MGEIVEKTKKEVRLCSVAPEFLDKLRAVDDRVGRPDICYIISLNGVYYAVPLIYGMEGDVDIIGVFEDEYGKCQAMLSFATMFPVSEDVLTDITDGYGDDRLFIAADKDEITATAVDIYMRRYNRTDPRHLVLSKICCDYRALEKLVSK